MTEKKEKKKKKMSFLVATTSLPAVDRPNADRWNAARSCQYLVAKILSKNPVLFFLGHPVLHKETDNFLERIKKNLFKINIWEEGKQAKIRFASKTQSLIFYRIFIKKIRENQRFKANKKQNLQFS